MDTEGRAMGTEFRRGQALIEMAMGMFALALVLASLFGFIAYIVTSLDMHRDLRADAGRAALNSVGMGESYSSKISKDTVEIEPFAAEYVFGSQEIEVKEEVHLPSMGIQK